VRAELVDRGERSAGPRALAATMPRPHRGAIVSFSGLDGAGKSSQSAALAETLDRLGHPAIVLWSPLGGGPVLNAFGKPAKRLLKRLRFGPFRELADRAATGSVMSARPGTGGTPSGGSARAAWATLVAASDAAAQRVRASRHTARGRVVVFDRHALDSVVRLRFLYGQSDAMHVRRSLVRLLAPRSDLAFLLDIRAETSRARKDDIWSLDDLQRHAELYAEEVQRLPVVRLDGERDREELCAEIARAVWHRLTERRA
jgi:thymidylate kinase